MSESIAPETCPDCGSAVHVIKIIDHRYPTGSDTTLEYAAEDATRHWFTGLFPVAGKVRARMCAACGRIVLRGEPRNP